MTRKYARAKDFRNIAVQTENESISRILCLRSFEQSGDHSSSPFVTERVERPTRRLERKSPLSQAIKRIGRAALVAVPLFGLALHGVCLATCVATTCWCALTLSAASQFRVKEGRRTVSPIAAENSVSHLTFRRLAYSLLHLSSSERKFHRMPRC